ncbi:uncharacterized protein LOC113229628 isoform X2 [Hyposmocoma kahamanoa]|uniref:uncharacterized protein LOC113229628 isoform X2 n=1 Tax=Hyposmocoma kahamanoa TaxID=1477025 RepID=UPI000E6DA2BA|nr:uncharacterized protein LOC113229628 isoform X2 [Hyposmocoma kahamanoa]
MHIWWAMCTLAGAVTAGGVHSAVGDGGRWRWPEGQDVRIDTKVQFLDASTAANRASSDKSGLANGKANPHADAPFKEATETNGFYNRPPGDGRFPVRSVDAYRTPYPVNAQAMYHVHDRPYPEKDETMNSPLFCKCVSTPECSPRRDSNEACGAGRYLCCYKRPNKENQQNTEFFNEIDDERPMLFPSQEEVAGPFPAPPNSMPHNEFGPGHGHETMILGTYQSTSTGDELFDVNLDISDRKRPIIFGPGRTGKTGPQKNNGVLVGPGGPTGVIGPAPVGDPRRDSGLSASAQRGILVGPGGPTGVIGPYGRNHQHGVLMGPVRASGFGTGYMRTQGPGVLVGPGGPTGIIGPGRRLLVGPGGPTGQIGPRGYFDYGRHKPKEHSKTQKKYRRRNQMRTRRAAHLPPTRVVCAGGGGAPPCHHHPPAGGYAKLLNTISSTTPVYFRAAPRRLRCY